MKHDLTKLDIYVRAVHNSHTPMRLPALKGRDIAALVKLLRQPAAHESKTIH
ncbi:MAG: hypothetical protein WBF84_11815 [Castellaniella sp.]|jgi:hypothetical protein|uniref:hypothetical protein n=1 Tax=Castellaniella sp. TaxID=1955812 RepID=UPI0026197F84|nr:hypothetical protein [uncultured Castellaniella sp.]